MNLELITSVIIGCFIYNVILTSIGAALLKAVASNKAVEKGVEQAVKKKFKDRLTEEQNKT